MKDWRYWLAEQRGTLIAVAIFIAMFIIYISNHQAGLTANVVNTAANKGTLLALVAMAQALVVITAGIDLSVGTIFVLTNCVASYVITGNPFETATGVALVLLVGLVCGAINGAIVIYGRLQPIVATIGSGAVFFGIALMLRPLPGGTVNETLADAHDWPNIRLRARKPPHAGCHRSRDLGALSAFSDRARGVCGGFIGGGSLYVGRAHPPRQVHRLCTGWAAGRHRRAVPHLLHLFRPGIDIECQHLHFVLDRRSGAGWRIALRRQR